MSVSLPPPCYDLTDNIENVEQYYRDNICFGLEDERNQWNQSSTAGASTRASLVSSQLQSYSVGALQSKGAGVS